MTQSYEIKCLDYGTLGLDRSTCLIQVKRLRFENFALFVFGFCCMEHMFAPNILHLYHSGKKLKSYKKKKNTLKLLYHYQQCNLIFLSVIYIVNTLFISITILLETYTVIYYVKQSYQVMKEDLHYECKLIKLIDGLV